MTDRLPRISTLAVHAGAQPDPATGARATPIYQTTAFVFEDADHAAALFNLQVFGNIYSRIMNPTNAVLEERVAALEGGTRRARRRFWSRRPARRPAHADAARRRIRRRAPALWWFDQPVQPGLRKFDWHVNWADTATRTGSRGRSRRAPRPSSSRAWPIRVASSATSKPSRRIAHAAGVPLIVDNTLASPYLIRPIEWGADIVLHSATKFLGGHGNSMAGIIVDSGKFDWGSGKYPS